ncbi:TetR family transcriptional regulator [Rhodococcus sp. ADH]|jgi:AcrR family transcriptional regulator|uniref:TetR/AcrR family transcriptional regulator n=1 Tax=Rhodococcus TaxID=1827 RepID=UPI0006BA5554|nr:MULTISPECIES: TetR/AcrR family transcriptional regulator [Rhodococcus]KPH21490.1 TetR family transcriptional regulator [Rhodococcus sp. ADH]MEA1798047.1 TetR family transcriptional regulator [Rhodococcus qingshengii]RGP45496.1 TetR family transcriptional regulator [Rhodococcus erythropolis]
MVKEKPEKISRAERKEHTAAKILSAARRQFAEHGFDRTTIRAIATDAGIDPALVMQLHSNKEQLFAAAAQADVDLHSLIEAPIADLPEAAAAHLFSGFEDPSQRDSSEALLRSCLTHPLAGQVLRDQVLAPAQATVATTIGGDDAELRAAVLNACTLGVTIARYLLKVPAMAQADQSDLERILRPALSALTETHPAPQGARPA